MPRASGCPDARAVFWPLGFAEVLRESLGGNEMGRPERSDPLPYGIHERLGPE